MNLRIEALAHSPRPVLCAALLLIGGGLPAAAQSLSWVRQLGTTGGDQMDAAAPDGAGGVFSCGSTQGSLGGPSAGSWDAWLAHHDAAGNSLWTRQIGTTFGDYVSCAASDTAGGFYVGGQTEASLGGPGAGFFDAWFARYDAAGNQLWIRQFGAGSRHV